MPVFAEINGTKLTYFFQLNAVVNTEFDTSSIAEVIQLLDERLYIPDGKCRTDFVRMFKEIKECHDDPTRRPSPQGGTLISFPIFALAPFHHGSGLPPPAGPESVHQMLTSCGVSTVKGITFFSNDCV